MQKSDMLKSKLSQVKNNNLMKSVKQIIQSEFFPFLILFIAMIILHKFVFLWGDDIYFSSVPQKYTLPGYLNWRYLTWAGRVSAEGTVFFIFKDGAKLWRIINPMFIVLFAYSISRLVTDRNLWDQKSRRSINWFICLGWLYISKEILWESVFWVTGSVYYLWTVTAGLIALLPFKDAVAGESKSSRFNVIYIISAMFAALGQEQISLIIVVFSIIINIQLYIKHKKVQKILIIESVIIILCFLILYLAPGNYVRIHSEINTWMPNYPLYDKFEIGFSGVRWLLDCIINRSRLMLLMLTILLGFLVFFKYKGIRSGFFTVIPFIGSILLFLAILLSIYVVVPDFMVGKVHFPEIYYSTGTSVKKLLFNFYMELKLYNIKTIKFIVWPVFIFLIPFYLFMLYKFTLKSFYYILIYLAGICSAVILFFSPTIYASGYRTIFIMNVSLFLVFIFLLKDIKGLLKNRYIILFSLFPIFKCILIYLSFKK